MNTLSWLIYLAEFTNSVNVASAWMIAIGGAIWAMPMVVFVVSNESLPSAEERGAFPGRWGLWIAAIALLINVIAPARQTVLLIAASEMGERVLNHPRVNQVVDPGIDLLSTWMRSETEKLRREMASGTEQRR